MGSKDPLSPSSQLAADPYGMAGVKKLTAREGYRLRVGDWRILYTIRNDVLIICILDAGNRKERQMNVQFIEDNGIPAFAVLPIDEFNRLIQPLEDAADASAIERLSAAVASGTERTYPHAVIKALVEGENPVRVFREYRNMTPARLASACGVTAAHIYQIESGKRSMSVDVLRKMTQVLDVDADMLI